MIPWGALMSYQASFASQARRAAWHAEKILKGAKPGDLPVEQPSEIRLTINLETAKAIGVAIPGSLLSRADQVID
jgi:putative ABC transport system substrate-binding protein